MVIGYCFISKYRAVIGYYIISVYRAVIGYCGILEYRVIIVYSFISEYRVLIVQWVRLLDITAHTSLSPIRRGFAPSFVNKKVCNRLATASDNVYQLLAQDRWFSPGTPVFSTTKTGRHDILLKVALNNKNQIIFVFQIIEWLSDITSSQRIELSNIVSFQSIELLSDIALFQSIEWFSDIASFQSSWLKSNFDFTDIMRFNCIWMIIILLNASRLATL